MKNTFFSVVIPAYNRAHILHETINSILNQSFQDFEIIIVDDGSTDNTKDVVQLISEADARVQYIYQKNAERSAARNTGIKNAKGLYICFLDSDDLFENNHLQILFDYASNNNNPVELIFTNCFYLTDKGKEKPNLPLIGSNAVTYFVQNAVVPARVCIHKDILHKYKFRPDIVIVEDTVLWTTIANKNLVKHIEEYTIQYRIHDDNSVNLKNNCFLPRLKGLRKLFKHKEIAHKTGRKLISEAYSNCYLGIAKHYHLNGKKTKQFTWLFYSLIKYPLHRTKEKLYLMKSIFF